MDGASLLISMTLVAISVSFVSRAFRVYRTYGGTRPVICPETHGLVNVQIDSRRAVTGRLVGKNTLRRRSYSRWPLREGCDQACLAQIIPMREPRNLFRLSSDRGADPT